MTRHVVARTLAAILFSTLLSARSGCQSKSLVGAIGVQHLSTEGTGVSFLGGIGLTRAPFLATIPLELSLMPSTGGRYRSETTSSGQSICRDTTNGQFADSGLCGPKVLFAGSADVLGFMRPDSLHAIGLGGGYRVGPSGGPFGAVVFAFGTLMKNWNLKARAGSKMIELSIGGSWQ